MGRSWLTMLYNRHFILEKSYKCDSSFNKFFTILNTYIKVVLDQPLTQILDFCYALHRFITGIQLCKGNHITNLL